MIPLIVFALLVSVTAFVPVTPIPPQIGKSTTTNTSPYKRRTRVSEVEHTGQQQQRHHHHGFPSQLNYSKMKSSVTHRIITKKMAAKGTIPNPNESEIVAAEYAAELIKQERLRSSYGVLAILLFTFASNQWSRQALYYLCDFSANADPFKHINAGLGFDKENYAALASFGFTLIFAGVSLVAGGVADTYDRNRVTAASCAVWSVGTALQAFATSFSDLIPLRSVIGASQAFYNPAAYTLLAELFPKKMIGSINGIFSSGIYLGGALASLSIILDGVVGWRNTLLIIGGVGIVAALLCLFLVTDPRSFPHMQAIKLATEKTNVSTSQSSGNIDNVDEKKAFSFDANAALLALQQVLESRDAQLLFVASALRFCAGFSIAIWKAPFVFAKFPESVSAFAGSNAAVVAGGGFLSSLIGGYVSDRLASPSDPTVRPRARCWVPAIGSLLAAPLWAAFILSKDPAVAALCLLGEYLTAECWFGPTLASLFQVVPRDTRGTAQGFFSVLTAAGNIAPVLVGAFAGGQLGSFALGDVLIASVSGSYILSGFLFAAVALADDQRIQAEWDLKTAEETGGSTKKTN